MKVIGYFLILIGISLFLFIGYSLVKNRNKLHSPIPEEKGIKVIFISPSK